MAEHTPRSSFPELVAPGNGVRGAAARLAERIQRTAETYRGEEPLARLAADARGVQAIERRVVTEGVKRLNLATEAGVERLRVRVAECQRRLGEGKIEARATTPAGGAR
jgi:hypothetical protein